MHADELRVDPGYLEAVPELVFKHGGPISLQDHGLESVEMPPGMPTTFVVLIEWPDARAEFAE
jgi:hypothetical protein